MYLIRIKNEINTKVLKRFKRRVLTINDTLNLFLFTYYPLYQTFRPLDHRLVNLKDLDSDILLG